MVETRSQTGDTTVKKEEQEDRKPDMLLNSVTMTTRNKITKRTPSIRNNRHLPTQQVKTEEETDTKSLLQSTPKSLKLPKGQSVSQEQINQLIDYIVNDNMSINKAAFKVKMARTTGAHYYNQYKNDPDKKIPSPRNQFRCPRRFYTQEHIENLIKYIVHDKMSVVQASAKANMNHKMGYYYYNKYLKDSDRNIPIHSHHRYTQDQKKQFISCIVNDKMSVKAASKKANIHQTTARKYYLKYFDGRNPDIATPSHITVPNRYTHEQRKQVISYIVDSRMTIAAASKKANMNFQTARIYFQQYLKDHNTERSVSKCGNRYTQNEINKFISYITDDEMTLPAASKKAKMSYSTGYKYYHRHLIYHNLEAPTRRYTQDQKSEFIGYIVDDKMTIKAASKKANIHYRTGHKYYMEYRKKHNIDLPALKYRQDKIKEIAGYVIDEKMSVKAAARKANVSEPTGRKYYRKYLMDKKRDVPS